MDDQFADTKKQRVLTCAASLAYYGLLGSVKNMILNNVDLSQVPAQHMASLTSCVTGCLHFGNLHNCDLVGLFKSLSPKCTRLYIKNQSLGREETQALVQAMESRVELVMLWGESSLDIEALAKYSGQGVCREVRLEDEAATGYREEMRTWTRSTNWRVAKQTNNNRFWIMSLTLSIERDQMP